jgi:hypothetical protein
MIGTVLKSFKNAIIASSPNWAVEMVREDAVNDFMPTRNSVLIVFDGAEYPDIINEGEVWVTDYPVDVKFKLVLIMKDMTKDGFGIIDENDRLLKLLTAYDFSGNFTGYFRKESIGKDETWDEFVKIQTNVHFILSGY